MDEFIKIFMAIDANNNDEISTRELVNYARKHHLSETIVTRWKTLFDPYNTGIITLNNFLDGLGIKMNEYLIYKRKLMKEDSDSLKLPSDVQKVSGDMPIEKQLAIVGEVRNLRPLIKGDNFESIARELKKYLDLHYSTSWHVVVVPHSFASAFTHEVGASFTFKMFGICFTVWKTQEKYMS